MLEQNGTKNVDFCSIGKSVIVFPQVREKRTITRHVKRPFLLIVSKDEAKEAFAWAQTI